MYYPTLFASRHRHRHHPARHATYPTTLAPMASSGLTGCSPASTWLELAAPFLLPPPSIFDLSDRATVRKELDISCLHGRFSKPPDVVISNGEWVPTFRHAVGLPHRG